MCVGSRGAENHAQVFRIYKNLPITSIYREAGFSGNVFLLVALFHIYALEK